MLIIRAFLILILLFDQLSHASIRIMPLGDSITAGSGSTQYNGYRESLYLQLDERYVGVDFVGSLHVGTGHTFDWDHEGHGGWTAEQVGEYVYDWLVLNPPDIILLNIGTNGIWGTPAVDIYSDIVYILDEIDRFDPNITVFLAQITLNTDYGSYMISKVNELNGLIGQTNRQNVIIVNMNILEPEDFYVATPGIPNAHPNDTGYDKMADAWFESIDCHLSSTIQFNYDSVPGSGYLIPAEDICNDVIFDRNIFIEIEGDITISGSLVISDGTVVIK